MVVAAMVVALAVAVAAVAGMAAVVVVALRTILVGSNGQKSAVKGGVGWWRWRYVVAVDRTSKWQ